MAAATRPSPGRHLRRLAGVHEPLLDLVPSERARCTSMGGVVLGTAAIATISMAVALEAVFGSLANPLAMALALLWGLFVLNLDRWLMSTVVESAWPGRLLRFVPRIGLAVMFGVIIAEPLLLGIFDSAIEKQIRDDRTTDLLQFEQELRRCNPPQGPAARPATCVGGLSVGVDPASSQAALTTAQQRAAQIRGEAAPRQQRHAELVDRYNQECEGTAAPGLSGLRGEGPRCERLGRTAADYRRDSGLERNEQELGELTRQLPTLEAQARVDPVTYETRIGERITELVAERRSAQRKIGLQERFQAMATLVDQDPYVHNVQWGLRVFFIIVDSLPVLVKLISGMTAYDRITAGRLARQERAQQLAEGTEAYQDTVAAGVKRYAIDLDGTAQRERASVRAGTAHQQAAEQLRRLLDPSTPQPNGNHHVPGPRTP